MEPRNRILKEFTLQFKNDFETDFLIEEIFMGDCYKFESSNSSPLIIDCGAHIGVSVLYFKHLYPDAKIIALEPDEKSFKLLKKNVMFNNLNDVVLYNAAVSNFEGKTIMYGDLSCNSESVGNTIVKEWGDRNGFTTIMVPVLKLSKIIKNENVDFLKIDTEGTELRVLEDIKKYIHNIKNIYIEFHEHISNKNDLQSIIAILEEANFIVSINELNLTTILSEKYPLWVENYNPSVHILKGIKP